MRLGRRGASWSEMNGQKADVSRFPVLGPALSNLGRFP